MINYAVLDELGPKNSGLSLRHLPLQINKLKENLIHVQHHVHQNSFSSLTAIT